MDELRVLANGEPLGVVTQQVSGDLVLSYDRTILKPMSGCSWTPWH